MATNELHDISIPSALRTGLKRLLRRYRLMVVLKGFSAALTVFLLGMFVVMGLDRLFIVPDWLRTGLSAIVWLASVCTLWIFLVRPLMRIPHQAALAASVEAGHPELAEKFSTSIELVSVPDRPEFRGSDELIGAVIHSADDDSRKVDFARVVHTERVRRFAFVAFVLVLAAGIFWTMWGADFTLMFTRFVAPWANLPRISSTELLVSPGDVLVARSDSQIITAVLQKGRASTCWLYVRTGHGPWSRIRMANQETGSFSHLLTSVDADIEYHLFAGDAITRDYTLTVVDRPAVTVIDVAYEFPPYTNLPPSTRSGKEGDLKAVLGTVARLTFHTNRPLAQGSIEIAKNVRSSSVPVAGVQPHQSLPLESAGTLQYKTSVTLDADGSYILSLRDENGFANAEDLPYRITALDDTSPVVEITEPEKTLVLPRVQPVNLGLHIEDDFGLAKVEMVYEVNNQSARRRELPLKGLGVPKITEVYPWSLADFGFRGGDVVRYHVEATDTRPGKPNIGISQTQYIRISFENLSQEQQALEQNLQRMQEQLNKMIDKLKQAKTAEETQIQDQAANFNTQQERERSTQRNLEEARQDTNNLSRMLSSDPVLNALQPIADEIAQTHIPNAQSEMRKTNPNRQPAENRPPVENALAETNNALAKAEAMQRQLDALAELEREQMRLAELAAREAQLAQDAAQNEQQPQDAAQALADRQQQIMNDTAAQQPDDQQTQDSIKAALDQMQGAKAQLQADGNGKQAGQKMDNAAKLLAQAASRMLSRGKPLKPTGNQGPANMDTRQLLMQLGLTPEEWNRLPGELRQELLESYDEKYPSEYRKLVREYFREISGTGLSKE